jgi:hypothetical protein
MLPDMMLVATGTPWPSLAEGADHLFGDGSTSRGDFHGP